MHAESDLQIEDYPVSKGITLRGVKPNGSLSVEAASHVIESYAMLY